MNAKTIKLTGELFTVKPNVKFRSKPSLKGKQVKCLLRDYNELYSENEKGWKQEHPEMACDGACPNAKKYFKYARKGLKLKVVGRTNKKKKIGKWKAYWYKVESEYEFEYSNAKGQKLGIDCSVKNNKQVWVYGQFLKPALKLIISDGDGDKVNLDEEFNIRISKTVKARMQPKKKSKLAKCRIEDPGYGVILEEIEKFDKNAKVKRSKGGVGGGQQLQLQYPKIHSLI